MLYLIALYNFDRGLRLILFDAIEIIEVALRAKIINHLSQAKDSGLWYLDASLFERKDYYEDFVLDLKYEFDRSTEPFAKEYIAEHPNWDWESMEGNNPDAWMILESATFGTLSKMYKNLKSQLPERAAIANDFGLYSAKELSSWLEAISALRNIIAHHSRLRNRVYLQMPLDEWLQDFRVEVCPGRTHVVTLDETNSAFITTNYRVLVERDAIDLLKYLCEKPEPMHELRVTARFSTQIAISREYNRHRVNSIAEESTRYCNYSKGKYGNEITISLPSWIEDDGPSSMPGFVEMCGWIHNGQDDIWSALCWWWFANLACEYSYMKLIEKGWTAQQARTILPLDTKTTLVHTAFVSDWQHFFDLRSRGTTGKPHPDAKVLADHLLLQFIERGYIHE